MSTKYGSIFFGDEHEAKLIIAAKTIGKYRSFIVMIMRFYIKTEDIETNKVICRLDFGKISICLINATKS